MNEIQQLKEYWNNSTWKVRISMLAIVLMTFLPFTTTVITITTISIYSDEIRALSSNYLIYLGLFFFFSTSLSLTSTTILSVIAGYFWGWDAYWYLLLMFNLGAAMGYYLTHAFDKGTMLQYIENKSEIGTFIQRLKERDYLMIFTLRITPVLPFAVTNVFSSYIDIKFWRYLLFGGIGIALRTLATVFTGTQIKSLNESLVKDPAYQMQYFVFIGVSIVLFAILYWFVMKNKK
jgi:uncharacterized membrane protein YdjX (TVP38/TMEM64 family)